MQITPPTPSGPLRDKAADPLHQRAQQLEAAFLSEMLSFAGLGTQNASFDGGEEQGQFASFLRDEQAKLIVKAGGIGLTERLVRAMEGQNGTR